MWVVVAKEKKRDRRIDTERNRAKDTSQFVRRNISKHRRAYWDSPKRVWTNFREKEKKKKKKRLQRRPQQISLCLSLFPLALSLERIFSNSRCSLFSLLSREQFHLRSVFEVRLYGYTARRGNPKWNLSECGGSFSSKSEPWFRELSAICIVTLGENDIFTVEYENRSDSPVLVCFHVLQQYKRAGLIVLGLDWE